MTSISQPRTLCYSSPLRPSSVGSPTDEIRRDSLLLPAQDSAGLTCSSECSSPSWMLHAVNSTMNREWWLDRFLCDFAPPLRAYEPPDWLLTPSQPSSVAILLRTPLCLYNLSTGQTRLQGSLHALVEYLDRGMTPADWTTEILGNLGKADELHRSRSHMGETTLPLECVVSLILSLSVTV